MQTFGKSLSFLDVLYSIGDPVTANLEKSDNIVFSLSFPITKTGITIVSHKSNKLLYQGCFPSKRTLNGF